MKTIFPRFFSRHDDDVLKYEKQILLQQPSLYARYIEMEKYHRKGRVTTHLRSSGKIKTKITLP